MAGQSSYVDALAAKYYGQIIASAPKAPAIAPIVAAQAPSWQPLRPAPVSTSTDNGTPEGGFWARQLDESRPIGKILDVLSQPLYRLTESAMDIGNAAANDGDIGGAVLNSLNPLANWGSQNSKVSPSDLLAGRAEDKYFDTRESTANSNNVRTPQGEAFLDQLSPDWMESEDRSEMPEGTQWFNDPRFYRNFGRGAVGFAADVLGDPLTYIPGGAIKSVVGGVAGAAGKAAVRGVDKAAEAATAAGKTDSFAQRLSADIPVIKDRARAIKDQVGSILPAAQIRKLAEKFDKVDTPAIQVADNAAEATVKEEIELRNVPEPVIADVNQPPRSDLPTPAAVLGEPSAAPAQADVLPGPGASEAPWVPVATPTPTTPQTAVREPTATPQAIKAGPALYRNTETGEELPYAEVRKRIAAENATAGPKYTDQIADLYKQVETPVASKADGGVPAPSVPVRNIADYIRETTRPVVKEGFENYRPAVAALHNQVKRLARQNKNFMSLAKLNTDDFIQAALNGLTKGEKRTVMEARAADIFEKAFEKPFNAGKVDQLNDGSLAEKMAREDVAAKATRTSLERKTGAELIEWVQEQSKFLDSHDLVALLNAGTRKQFTDRRRKIQNKKLLTTVETSSWTKIQSDMMQMPEVAQQVDEGLSSAEVPPFMAAASGANLDEATRDALSETGNLQQWDLADPTGEFNKVTKIQGTRRNAAQLGEGRGINREGATRYYQRVLFGNIIKRSAEELFDKGLKGKERSQAMMDLAMPRMRAAEEFLEANGIFVHAGGKKAGIPIRLTQMLDALSSTTKGKNWVLRKVFSAYDPKPNTSGFEIRKALEGGTASPDMIRKMVAYEKANAIADVDGILRFGEHVVERINTYRQNDVDLGTAIQQVIDDLTHGSDDTFRALEDSLFNAEMVGGKRQLRPQANRVDSKGRHLYRDVPIVKEGAQAMGGEPPIAPSGFLSEALEVFGRPETLRGIVQSAYDNSARAGILFGRDVAEISNDTISRVVGTLDDPNIVLSDKVKVLVDTSKVTKQVAKEVKEARKLRGEAGPGVNGSTEEVVKAADVEAKAKLTEVIPEVDVNTARNMDKVTKATEDSPLEKVPDEVNEPNYDAHKEQVEAEIQQMPLVGVVDPDNVENLALQTGIMRALDWSMRNFANHYGNVTFHTAMQVSGNVAGVMARSLRHKLKATDQLAKNIAQQRGIMSRDVWKEAFEAIQKNADEAVDPSLKEFTDLVRQSIDPIFDVSRQDGTESILGLWAREGFDLIHIENKLRSSRYGLPDSVTVKQNAKKTKDIMTNRKFSDLWRDWKIEDPLDFIAKMHTISTELATETSISREFFRIGQGSGLVAKSPRPGFVKVPRSYRPSGKKSYIARYLPADANGNSYMHPDAFREMRRMDDLFQQTYERGGKLESFMRTNVDPILSMWKSGMTIWRPGHHVRTFMGDVGMAYLMSGVKDPKYYLRSLKIAASKKMTESGQSTFRGDYGEWDAMRALQGLSDDLDIAKFKTHNKSLADELTRLGGVSGNFSGAVAKTVVGNTVHEIDIKTMWRALMDRGVLPDFRRQEDIVEVESGWAQKIQKKAELTGGRARTKLGNFTEGRDDTIRIAHALHLLENGIDNKGWTKGMSLNDVFDATAAQLRKSHPDGTDLTPTEQKVMRRIFPFYSWTRKAIPLVMESMVMHPGRFMAYPKAMYNFGAAQGIDLESVSDPFPDNQLFPEFLTDQMTGVGFKANDSYYTFSLGQPQADIMKEFFAGTTTGGSGVGDLAQGFGQGMMGMLNPGLSVPVELLSGKDLATGAEIRDTGEAIEQTIPGVNALSSITGVSPLGSLETLAQGQGLDPLAQVERGNREQFDPQYLANYLTGMQFTNASRPNYINLAEIEQRNEIAARQQE